MPTSTELQQELEKLKAEFAAEDAAEKARIWENEKHQRAMLAIGERIATVSQAIIAARQQEFMEAAGFHKTPRALVYKNIYGVLGFGGDPLALGVGNEFDILAVDPLNGGWLGLDVGPGGLRWVLQKDVEILGVLDRVPRKNVGNA